MVLTTGSVPFLKEQRVVKSDEKPAVETEPAAQAPAAESEAEPVPGLAKAAGSGDPAVHYLLAAGLDPDELKARLAEFGCEL